MTEHDPSLNPDHYTPEEVLDGRRISKDALDSIMNEVGLQEPAITNFAEAKAYRNWQDAQEPEAQAAANALNEQMQERDAEQATELQRKSEQLAQNPNAITGIPEHLK